MEVTEKFLFETTFDNVDGVHDPNLKEAGQLDEAYQRGKQAGLAEAMKSIEQAIADAEATIVEQLANLDELRDKFQEAVLGDVVRIALSVTEKIMPALAIGDGFGEIETLIADCLHRLMAEPRVVFRVPDQHLDRLQEKVAGLCKQAGYEGQTVLIADPDLGPSDCRIEWADGGMERDAAGLWQEVEQTVARTLGVAENTAASAGAPDGAAPALNLDNGQGA